MEILAIENHRTDEPPVLEVQTPSSFIEANTITISLEEIENRNIVPVFSKDNETAISHGEFIETTYNMAKDYFNGATLLPAQIRVSHPIKGRVPEARNKAANELMEHEKTLYYERMAFCIEIPEISREIMGNKRIAPVKPVLLSCCLLLSLFPTRQ